MQTKELYFDLPAELIAQHPRLDHHTDRLLCINRRTGEYEDKLFSDLPNLLPSPSLLVLNDSRVRKARVFATNDNGGRVELLFLNPMPTGEWKCMSNRRKKRRVGERLYVPNESGANLVFTISNIFDDETILLSPSKEINESFFDTIGHVPLPPYIKRDDEFSDESAYQTIYAKPIGSVASPTSGLHYTQDILEKIEKNGIKIVKITLHVGMGTFLPLRTERLEEHKMHSEYYSISQEVADTITSYKADGKPIIASGTTVIRTLESAWQNGKIIPGSSQTDIFITPGYKFKVADKLITNFHTPQSTLLSLVAAFSTLDIVKNAYKHAIEEKYRFFSYGDCTFFF